MIRQVLGDRNVIELRRRIILWSPGFAAVERHISATVVAVDHAVGIVRGDPQIVIVAMRHTNGLVRFPAIRRFEKCGIEDVHRVAIFWISVDSGVVEPALPHFAIFADLLPGGARIV